jgi:hypothetical protein
MEFQHPCKQFIAAQPGHRNISQHHIERFRFQFSEGFFGCARLLTLMVQSEQLAKGVADYVIVIHNQYLSHDGPPTLLTKGVF